ncbi:hypothetical protein [Desulfovibrio sp. TomC]|uniref:hypothetical protein n=1 Tax=Desulfovibrio sp. TomC TaxID=1562888 RepID=UPI0018CC8115|nr:hypothetical protein [Desulfovibrio sp. TomC]
MSKEIKIFFSLACMVLVTLHVYNLFKLDMISLVLLCVAILPWVSRWISPWVQKCFESIKFGDFEAKFRELKETVDATKQELDKFKSIYIGMEDDYLKTCSRFNPNAETKELDKLASLLKSKAKGLASIDFLFSGLENTDDQALAFGAACALHVRPQIHAVDGVLNLLDNIVSQDDLRNFRLKTVYRLLMAINQIVMLDLRENNTILTDVQRAKIECVIKKTAENKRCKNDDTATFALKIRDKVQQNT